jgi:putative spermidine/putrescine transport system ATP-binding protein
MPSKSIVALTYHGGHVDLQIECPACGPNGEARLLIRSVGDQALLHWPPGAEVGISINAEGCAAFPLP